MTKTVSEILFAAADLIEPEGAWTQDWFAHDENGEEVDAWSHRAVCWCALGAVRYAAIGTDQYDEASVVLHELGGVGPIDTWNDAPERTQAEVVAKLREAAEKAREQGQ